MKNFRCLLQLFTLSIGLTLGVARGADFNYSYLFGDGLLVSGSLTGTQNGLFVDNVSNVTMRFNGVLAPGSIFSSKYDASSPNQFVSGAVVSFDALKNNFLFSNSNVVSGDFSYDSFFNMLNTSVYPFDTAVALSLPLNAFGSQDLPTLAQNWKLTAVSTPPVGVPDGGMTFAMLGITLAGLLGIRRKL